MDRLFERQEKGEKTEKEEKLSMLCARRRWIKHSLDVH